MRRGGVTIRALAARMQITQRRVREARANGVSGSEVVRDWLEGVRSPRGCDCAQRRGTTRS
jgi:hypothetical protein